MTNNKTTITVWDPVVRFGHWVLVAAFSIAYITEDELLTLHVWAGYTVAAVLAIRLVWGVVGSRYARFSSFVYKPETIKTYLKNLRAFKPQHYIGHNPAGGLMVIALLLSLAGTALSGMKLYAVEEQAGPLAAFEPAVTRQSPVLAGGEHEAAESRKKPKDSIWEEIHELFANFTLVLVCLHIAGVAASSLIDKEALVKAMITGKKTIDDRYQ